MYHTHLRVDGMACGACVMKVTSALEDLGAENVRVDLSTGEASFDSEKDPGLSNIVQSLTKMDYRPHDLMITKTR
jgi:copper chaperone CopZ